MDNLPRNSGSNGDADLGSEGRSISSAPRWVKVLGIIALVFALLFIILHLSGRGLGGHTGHSGVTEHSVRRPCA